MAHYVFLDENNTVTEVITGRNEAEKGHNGEDIVDWEQFYGNIRGQVCKRTSYNTEKNGMLIKPMILVIHKLRMSGTVQLG